MPLVMSSRIAVGLSPQGRIDAKCLGQSQWSGCTFAIDFYQCMSRVVPYKVSHSLNLLLVPDNNVVFGIRLWSERLA